MKNLPTNTQIEEPVGLVNNLITDAFDMMYALKASDVAFVVNQRPVFLAQAGMVKQDTIPGLSHYELIEDMQALGIDMSAAENGYYRHTLDDGSNETMRIRLNFSLDRNGDYTAHARWVP